MDGQQGHDWVSVWWGSKNCAATSANLTATAFAAAAAQDSEPCLCLCKGLVSLLFPHHSSSYQSQLES